VIIRDEKMGSFSPVQLLFSQPGQLNGLEMVQRGGAMNELTAKSAAALVIDSIRHMEGAVFLRGSLWVRAPNKICTEAPLCS